MLNHNWERFTKDIGRPDLLTDERFNPYYIRWDNRHLLEPIVEEWFQSLGSREEVLKFLLDRHYLAAPVMDLRQTVEMIKGEGRGALQNLKVPGYGEVPVPKVPYLFSETKVEFKPILSMVGEDNRAILSELLGYSEQKLDELRRRDSDRGPRTPENPQTPQIGRFNLIRYRNPRTRLRPLSCGPPGGQPVTTVEAQFHESSGPPGSLQTEY